MTKIKCKVCNHKLKPEKENRYTAYTSTAVLLGKKTYYDCFDCPECGCQIVAGERFDREDLDLCIEPLRIESEEQ